MHLDRGDGRVCCQIGRSHWSCSLTQVVQGSVGDEVQVFDRNCHCKFKGRNMSKEFKTSGPVLRKEGNMFKLHADSDTDTTFLSLA